MTMVKILGQKVNKLLVLTPPDNNDYNSVEGFEQLDPSVAEQAIALRYLYYLTHDIGFSSYWDGAMWDDSDMKLIHRYVKRGIINGQSLSDILRELLLVFSSQLGEAGEATMGDCADQIMTIVREHKSVKDFGRSLEKVDMQYKRSIMCAVVYWYKKNQSMVKACRD